MVPIRTTHTIFVGDSRKMLSVPDISVEMVMTSPPLWKTSRPKTHSTIGSESTFEEYTQNLELVWQQCYRVLIPGGRICIQASDQITRVSSGRKDQLLPVRARIICSCERLALDYMGTIICRNESPTGTSIKSLAQDMRLGPGRWLANQNAVAVLLFRKPGRRTNPNASIKKTSKMTSEEWRDLFRGHWTWPKTEKQITERCIRMFSFTGDTVVDPFLRDGTTTFAARVCHRSSLAYTDHRAALRKVMRTASDLSRGTRNRHHLHIDVKEEKK
jgi:modification methylase